MRLLIALISNALIIFSTSIYIKGVFKKEIIPHAFTWLIWTIILTISFFAQISDGGGLGSYLSLVDSLLCLFVFIISLKFGVKKFATVDWIALALSLTGIILWQQTSQAVYAAILVSLADGIAWIPTYRKSWNDPGHDSILTFAIGVISFGLTITVLDNYSLTTWLYPASVMFTNSAFIVLLITRRSILLNKKTS